MRRTARVLAAAALVLVVAWIVHQVGNLTTEAQAGRNERAAVRAELEQTQADSQALAEQVRSLGEEPVVEPDPDGADKPLQERFVPVPGPRGRDGDAGRPGRDGAPGESITGPAGPAGKDGASVTGPAGADGAPGKDGEQGPAGPAGPAGKDGRDGTEGQPGKDGRSITSVSCPEQDWVITYSDGTTDTVTGPCRLVSPLPTP